MKPIVDVFDKTWRARCDVLLAANSEVDPMIRRHYLAKWPGVRVLTLALTVDGNPAGVIVFALPPRETMKRYGCETWELARLWVCDSVPQNGETYLISQAIKYIKRNYRHVGMLVSYADPSAGHSGVIYRAANWKPDGRTDDDRKTPRFDYADANSGKKYSRASHIPIGTAIKRIPRVSKWRFIYRLTTRPLLMGTQLIARSAKD